jgi:cytochrome P450
LYGFILNYYDTKIHCSFFSGIEQTAHGVGFILYLLAKSHTVQDKLREELQSVQVGG